MVLLLYANNNKYDKKMIYIQKSMYFLLLFGIVSIFLLFGIVLNVAAQSKHTSPSYGVDEVLFGAGGVTDANSANYNARASLGDTVVGNSGSSLYQIYGGYTTTDVPFLEFTVSQGSVDLGTQSPSNTSSGSTTFTVKAYLSSGYVVQTVSDPPKNSSYTMATPNTPTPSSVGVEQFGMNLRANTVPTAIGADPVQIPDASFSYGQVSPGYNTPNMYKYNKYDNIAFSNKSSGVTQYTITYIMNVSNLTPAGVYAMNQSLVATATY